MAPAIVATGKTDNVKGDSDGQLDHAVQTGPRCEPIRTVGELEAWRPSKVNSRENVEPLADHYFVGDNQTSKVLFCHDMKGGYLDDDRLGREKETFFSIHEVKSNRSLILFFSIFSIISGTSNVHAFRFDHWSRIDMFCYFTHNFVTIPTVGWINAAHKNGVTVLGTVITESVDGASNCRVLLQNDISIEVFASQLAYIAQHYQFDGWLVNIENPVNPALVDSLVCFVRTLQMKTSALLGQKATVLWYDSVNYPNGNLNWQNELNGANEKFYEACNGIYLNYGWNRDGLQQSAEKALMHGRNVNSIYVGVDVFGRGVFGGGGWNTKAAIDEIKNANANLSIALFAPGWVHEVEVREDAEMFHELDMKFWRLLDLPVRHYPKLIPFSTSFNRGLGLKSFSPSLRTCNKQWFNLSRQDCLPGTVSLLFPLNLDDAYEGGSCIQVNQGITKLELFRMEIPSDGCYLTVALKPDSSVNSLKAEYISGSSMTLTDNLLPVASEDRQKVGEWILLKCKLIRQESQVDALLGSIVLDVTDRVLLGFVKVSLD
ncbi:Cytosolic endo-beta-N-acetylglucosaminidase [Halotydeus destructor]|nr:Cytosolic endo-beta-N-acetylglucosaminidase [Halotydeus destructor]